MAIKPTIEVSTLVAAQPQEVWAALTAPEIIKSYFFGADVETDWREGSPIRFRGDWQGKKFEDKGEVKQVAPLRRLTFSHWSPLSGTPDQPENYHLLSYELVANGDGTKVTLSQTDLSGVAPINEKNQQAFRKNWETVLAGLKKAVEH